MKINTKLLRQKIDKVYHGNIKLLETTEGLSGVERILKAGKCSTGMAYTLCNVLHIPFSAMWEG